MAHDIEQGGYSPMSGGLYHASLRVLLVLSLHFSPIEPIRLFHCKTEGADASWVRASVSESWMRKFMRLRCVLNFLPLKKLPERHLAYRKIARKKLRQKTAKKSRPAQVPRAPCVAC